MDKDAVAGTDSGNTSFQNTPKCEQPSMMADSNDASWQLADVLIHQVDRQGKSEAGVGKPDS
jgi:hypothetical protein